MSKEAIQAEGVLFQKISALNFQAQKKTNINCRQLVVEVIKRKFFAIDMAQNTLHDNKIAVIGTSGSGKSVLAKKISDILKIPRVELDALHWDANWTEAPLDIFQQGVEFALKENSWVVDGNYGKVRDFIWKKADTIVWLDYSFHVVFSRALIRTLRRAIMREILWSGNRESFRRSFMSRDSILIWVLQTHNRRKREYAELLRQQEYEHIRVVRLRSQSDTNRYLNELFVFPI